MRSLVVILSILYFAVSSGIVMNVHYCMGKRQSVKLHVMSSPKCGCGKKMEKKKGCCKTESQMVKLAADQQAAYANFHIQSPEAAVNAVFPGWENVFVYSPVKDKPVAHAPPLLSEQDTYLFNCVFRI